MSPSRPSLSGTGGANPEAAGWVNIVRCLTARNRRGLPTVGRMLHDPGMISDRGTVTQLRPESGILVTRVHTINKGALVSFCDLHIEAWNLTIYDCKHFKTNNAEWIGLPSSTFATRDGKTKYKTLIEFTDEEAAFRFQQAALAAVLKFIAASPQRPTTPGVGEAARNRRQ